MKNILFRTDSSYTIGTGHIMRDLVLATQYSDSNIIFATQDLDGNINNKVREAGHTLVSLQSNDVKEFITVVKKHKADLVVIDNYKINFKYEQILKKKTGIQILAFDDTYEKHYCDILLNHNISANIKKYSGLLPKDCELRCGSKYTLLRNEFYEAMKQKTVFLAMGGADHANLNINILKVLKDFKNIRTIVLTTNANQKLKELKKYVKDKKNITLYINSNKIAKLMKKSDFAIISPSVTSNEAYFMKLPFIAIKTAKNQKDMYEYLKRKEYLILKKFNVNNLKKNIKKILQTLG